MTEIGLAFALAMGISALTVPAGVSGALFLLPAQLSVLGMPSPSVTPTNLLYNVIATPAAIRRLRRHSPPTNRLVRPVLYGALPGVALGAALRTTVASGAGVFRVLVGLLLVVLGTHLLRGARSSANRRPHLLTRRGLTLLGLATGTVGGLYGIGGGSILAPLLVLMGYALAEVAAAALTVTFMTSLAGVGIFTALAATGKTDAAPDWSVGIALGLGGLIGGYLGARWQARLSERTLRRLLGSLAVAVGVTYLIVVPFLTSSSAAV